MIARGKQFFELTAEDLMTRDVVTIPEEMSLPRAAQLLSRAQISGAPVVDANGICVGVVSATDFLHLAEKNWRGAPVVCAAPVSVCADWQVMEIDDLPAVEVCQHMTVDPVTATPRTPVRELARMMINAHIHRVIVLNAEDRPVGIVSSTDIIAAIASPSHEFEEADSDALVHAG